MNENIFPTLTNHVCLHYVLCYVVSFTYTWLFNQYQNLKLLKHIQAVLVINTVKVINDFVLNILW